MVSNFNLCNLYSTYLNYPGILNWLWCSSLQELSFYVASLESAKQLLPFIPDMLALQHQDAKSLSLFYQAPWISSREKELYPLCYYYYTYLISEHLLKTYHIYSHTMFTFPPKTSPLQLGCKSWAGKLILCGEIEQANTVTHDHQDGCYFSLGLQTSGVEASVNLLVVITGFIKCQHTVNEKN